VITLGNDSNFDRGKDIVCKLAVEDNGFEIKQNNNTGKMKSRMKIA